MSFLDVSFEGGADLLETSAVFLNILQLFAPYFNLIILDGHLFSEYRKVLVSCEFGIAYAAHAALLFLI